MRRELLERVLILGEAHLRAVLADDQVHYNRAPGRTRASPSASPIPDMTLPRPAMTDLDIKRIRRKPILSGLINEYARAA